MKSTLLYILLVLIPLESLSEEYKIDLYNVTIKVMPDGSLEISEEIDVHFTKKEHGIIRSIPIQNHITYLPDSLKSLRAEPTTTYFTKIYDIEVENFESQITENYHNILIRIGSTDKYVEGKQKYIIKYKVSGVVNPFRDHDEISWDIIGHEWNVPISKINFEIKFDKQISINKKNISIITGLKSEKNKDAKLNLIQNKIIGTNTKLFSPNEGISITLKLPKTYIEKTFSVKEIKTEIIQNYNGACTITDIFNIKFKNYQNGFIYSIPRKFKDKNGTKHLIYIKEIPNKNTHFYNIKEKENFYEIHLGGTIDTPLLNNNQKIEFTYETWGNIYNLNGKNYLYWSFFNNKNKDINTKCNYSVQNKNNIDFQKNKPKLQNLTYTSNNNRIKGKIISNNKLTSQLLLELNKNSLGEIPPINIIKNATNFYIENIQNNIKIDKDKEVHISQKMQFNFLKLNEKGNCCPFIYKITKSFFEDDYNYLPASYIKTSRKTFFTKQYKPYYSSIKINGKPHISTYNNELEISWLMNIDNPKTANSEINYSVYDIINKADSSAIVSIPILTNSSEPVRQTECRIEFPGQFERDEINCKLLRNDTLERKLNFIKIGNTINIKIPYLKKESTPFAIWVKFPSNFLSETAYLFELKLLIKNNYILLIPSLVLLILIVVWIIIGSNKKREIIVQYKPPERVTPIEASLIWNNKIQKKELVSLFFYWAANKNITIIQNKNNKLSFRLLKRLNKNSKKFESIIFNKIFRSKKIGEIVELDSFKGSFSSTLNKSFRKIKRYSKNNKFYSPGTIGFRRLLVVLSICTLAGSFLFFIVNLYFTQLVISLLSSSIVFFIFGKIMPKRAHLGNKIYYELIGFAEFIETAKLNRLEELTVDNPDYFANTLAYAIVIGKAEKWTQKFEPIFKNEPKWYENNNFNTSAIIFKTSIIEAKHKIEQSLINTPSSNTSLGKQSLNI